MGRIIYGVLCKNFVKTESFLSSLREREPELKTESVQPRPQSTNVRVNLTSPIEQVPVVQRADNSIQRVIRYPKDKMYWLEYSDLSPG